MKWYMALNEGGTRGDIALHTKLAILSARRYTKLDAKMLYVGSRNEFTDWLEANDVEVLDQQLPYLALIERLAAEGRYNTATVGHWLRTNVCLAERDDDYVFYTDVDILFRRAIDLESIRPTVFAAAPEFDPDSWNYVNAGVMVVNVKSLRDTYVDFEAYLRSNIADKTYGFHDQIAYNTFYRNRWERLPLSLNWKPYWGLNSEAQIIHFHGPKLGAIEAILDGRWQWETPHGMQIGSMLVEFLPAYKQYVGLMLEETNGLSNSEVDRIHRIHVALNAFERDPSRTTSLEFMNFRMFGE